jgi:hypothetical protein
MNVKPRRYNLRGILSVAFVRSSLNPWGYNDSANGGHYYLIFSVLPCSQFEAFKSKSPTGSLPLTILISSSFYRYMYFTFKIRG